MKLPHLIGICGAPESGKSLVQKILHDKFGVVQGDDGMFLRIIAVNHFGLSWDDVTTQEGKRSSTMINGVLWQNRKILGELGKAFENTFGEEIIPFIATQDLPPGGSYSFGSVRKTQGHFFKRNNGVMIAVAGGKNIGVETPENAFDRFDHSCVDHWIFNDGLYRGLSEEDALADLERKVSEVVARICNGAN